MTDTSIVKIEHVTAGYDADKVLNDVSLTVSKGDFIGIIGPNGGGKTTLLRVLLGLLVPMSGSVLYMRNGTPVKKITMGYLPQYNNIDKKFPVSVSEVVLSGLCVEKPLFRTYSKEQREQAMLVMENLEIDNLRNCHIGSLSGGQLQRVLLARAVVSRPEIVVLDEPNTYIDHRFQNEMYGMLSFINRDCAVVLVSHDTKSVKDNVKDIALVNRRLFVKPANDITDQDVETCFNGYGKFLI